MFSKIIVFLFFISDAFAYTLRSTPTQDLRELFPEVETQVIALQNETMIQIRANGIKLSRYLEEAKINTLGKITVAAEPFWDEIRLIQEAAEAQGVDISSCIDNWNNGLYTLNYTYGNETFDYYGQLGNNVIESSGTKANRVLQELAALEQIQAVCGGDTCATELIRTVMQFFERANDILIDAESKASDFVLVSLPFLLKRYVFDSASYAKDCKVYYNEFIDCLNKL